MMWRVLTEGGLSAFYTKPVEFDGVLSTSRNARLRCPPDYQVLRPRGCVNGGGACVHSRLQRFVSSPRLSISGRFFSWQVLPNELLGCYLEGSS